MHYLQVMQIFKSQFKTYEVAASSAPPASSVDSAFAEADQAAAADQSAIEGFLNDFAPSGAAGNQTPQSVVDPFLVDSSSAAPGAAQAIPGQDPVTGLPLPHQGRKVPTITEILTSDPSTRFKMDLIKSRYEEVINVLNREIAADERQLRDPSLSAAELRQVQNDLEEKQTELGVAQAGKAEADRYLAEDLVTNKKELKESTWDNPVDLNGDGKVGGKYGIGKIKDSDERIMLDEQGKPLTTTNFPKDPDYQAVLTTSNGLGMIDPSSDKVWESQGYKPEDFDAVLGLKDPQSTIDLQIPEYVMVEKRDGEIVTTDGRYHPLSFMNESGIIKQDTSNSGNAELIRVAKVVAESKDVTKIGGKPVSSRGFNQIITLKDKDGKVIARFQIQGVKLENPTAATAKISGAGNILFASTVKMSVSAQNTDKVHSTQKIYDFNKVESTGRYLMSELEMETLLKQYVPNLDMSKPNWEDAFIEDKGSLTKENLKKARITVRRNIYDTFMGEEAKYGSRKETPTETGIKVDLQNRNPLRGLSNEGYYNGANTIYIGDQDLSSRNGRKWTEGVVATNGVIFNGLSGHIEGTDSNDIFVGINERGWMDEIPDAYKLSDSMQWRERTVVDARGGRNLYFGSGNVLVQGATFAWVEAEDGDQTFLGMQDPKTETGNYANNRVFARVSGGDQTFIDGQPDGGVTSDQVSTDADSDAQNGIKDDYFNAIGAEYSITHSIDSDIPAGAGEGAAGDLSTKKIEWAQAIDGVTDETIEDQQTTLELGDFAPPENGIVDTANETLDGLFGGWSAPKNSANFDDMLDPPSDPTGSETGI